MATRNPTPTPSTRNSKSRPGQTAGAVRRGADLGRIETPKLAHIVAARLRRRIITGELPTGSSLPREADLMLQFGVSRPALREALRVLEAESMIALGRGARTGATVMAPSMSHVAQQGTFYLVANGTTLREIHEARTLIEPSIVTRLARQRPPDLVARLRACVEVGRKALAVADFKDAMLAVNEYHELLLQGAGNQALNMLVGMLHDIAVANYLALDKEIAYPAATKRTIGKSLDMLSEAVDLIESGAPDAAGEFWKEYLARATRVLAGSGRADQTIAL